MDKFIVAEVRETSHSNNVTTVFVKLVGAIQSTKLIKEAGKPDSVIPCLVASSDPILQEVDLTLVLRDGQSHPFFKGQELELSVEAFIPIVQSVSNLTSPVAENVGRDDEVGIESATPVVEAPVDNAVLAQ